MRYNTTMKKLPLLLLFPILFSGCFNERGISLRYYSECREYYDLQGYYHKECDDNLVDYTTLKEALRPVQNPGRGNVR
jgi:hypothetical protein